MGKNASVWEAVGDRMKVPRTHEADTISTNILVSHSDSAKPNSQSSKGAYVIAKHREMRVELHILFLSLGGLWSTPSLCRETNTPFTAGGIIFQRRLPDLLGYTFSKQDSHSQWLRLEWPVSSVSLSEHDTLGPTLVCSASSWFVLATWSTVRAGVMGPCMIAGGMSV